ncbi:MAG TPA: NADP-dependent oxidoreductase [Actinomycetales bacterium]|nr:NADP-dependent oxidoreductase [Actinomycetales bacterium]
MTHSREWQLVRRPYGSPVAEDFRLVDVELPQPRAGDVVVRNTWLTVDPYMRGRMDDRESYVAPFALDAPMDGGAVGVVEEVGADVRSLAPGDTVLHGHGWRERVVLEAQRVQKVDTAVAPAQAYLGVMGMPGLTAYVGLLEIARMQPGEIVFVSAAAGAVGSLVGQIARLKGAAAVIGSAGGAEKCAWLVDGLGFDAAIDYKAVREQGGSLRTALRGRAPDGIDVYFDNVGGEHLEAAIGCLRRHGRAAICGMISQYNATTPTPGPRNLALLVQNRLTLQGFLVGDHADVRPEFVIDMREWLRADRIVWRETVVDGIENAVTAFQRLLSGGNTGKMLVRLEQP